MSPLVLLLSKWLGGKGGQVNPYFNDPGSAPYTDSTFDANAQMPMQPNNFWQQLAGNNLADRINAEYALRQAQQPLIKELAKFQSDLGLEAKEKGLDIERKAGKVAEKEKAEQTGKTAFDVLSKQGLLSSIPISMESWPGMMQKPNMEQFGRNISFAYPQIGQQGLTTFSRSEADIARNLAEQIASENLQLSGRAQQPYIAPTTQNIAERGQIESSLGLDFARSPDFQNRIFPVSEARKYMKPIDVGTGQEVYDEATGTIIRGPTQGEEVVNKVLKVGDKEMAIPDIQRRMYPGSVSPFRGVGRIEFPDPSMPRSVETNKAPGEVSAPARNQDTTIGEVYNPLLPQTEVERLLMELFRQRMRR